MDLLARLESDLRSEESYFRGQLLREDLARLKRLEELARSAPDANAFKNEGRMLGWTQGDARTWELRATLDPLLGAFYATATGGGGVEADNHLLAAWRAFDTQRMEHLVGCLSRVPRPRD
jgi:hypothetical protein